MSLNQAEKATIKSLMRERGWETLMKYLGQQVDKYKDEQVKADTEFETIWRLAQRESKVEAIIKFFDNLERDVIQ